MRLVVIPAFVAVAAVTIGAHRSTAAHGVPNEARGQHAAEPHRHGDAAKLKNPVAADAKSLAEGKELYTANCADCHGVEGKGDGPMAAYTGDPVPSDLTDGTWQHGSTDGEIYALIHDGVENTGMRNFDKELTEQQIWHLVNYVRSLSPKPSPAH